MLKSYFSAIKGTLKDDGYDWNDSKVLLNTLTPACRVMNDKLKIRLPIQKGLLELMLFQLQKLFSNQPYLVTLYKAWFLTTYYGLFRVGELTNGNHFVRASNVHIGINKNKILFILHSSKTHDIWNHPQKIKIKAIAGSQEDTKPSQLSMAGKRRIFLSFRGIARVYGNSRKLQLN